MKQSTGIRVILALALPLLAFAAPAFDKPADAIASARAQLKERRFADALADADAGFKRATNQTEKTVALNLRAEILSQRVCDKMDAGQPPDDDIGELQKLPLTDSWLRAMVTIAEKRSRSDSGGSVATLRELLAKPELSDAQKLILLASILRIRLWALDIESAKSVLDEIRAVARAGKNLRIESMLVEFAAKAAEASDYPAAEACYREALGLASNNPVASLGAAQMALIRGDGAAAQADLQNVINNAKLPASPRYVARVIQAAAASPDAAAFRGAIARVDQEFAGEKYSDEQRFKMLREASMRLFSAFRYEDVRALEAETGAMLRSEPKKTFVCRYVKDPPRSADSWARSALIKESRYAETRFQPYPKGDELASELAALKGATNGPAPMKAGYDTRLVMVYDERGVHVYVGADDPEARQVDQGLVSGGSLELYFQPGKDAAYHQWFFSLPGTDEREQVNWDTPHRHYRYTYDYLVKDAGVTETGLGAYTFIPWLLVYDKLPSETNPWIFSMQRNSKGGFVTLGGAVHELGRAVQLKFEMNEEQLLAVKREIIARAFAKYQKDRTRLDGVVLWSDPELGDPAFDKAAIQPLLADLDKAGERIKEPMTAAEVDRVFAQVVPEWMELTYKTAELRQAYLEQKLLGVPPP